VTVHDKINDIAFHYALMKFYQ